MDTTNLSDSDNFNDVVPSALPDGVHGNVRAYIQELIRAGQNDKARALLESEMLKGINSGPPEPWTDEDLASIRAEVLRRNEARKAGN